jgi:hypothetical protein
MQAFAPVGRWRFLLLDAMQRIYPLLKKQITMDKLVNLVVKKTGISQDDQKSGRSDCECVEKQTTGADCQRPRFLYQRRHEHAGG